MLARLGNLTIAAAAVILAAQAGAQGQPPEPRQGESAAVVAKRAASTRMTEQYARMVARDAYFWAWPLVNIYNRRLAFKQSPEVGLMNGVLPFAPLNRMAMLHDYIQPAQRWVACPNQDTVYGAGIAALDESPVVLQVPDFGKRFWVYQVVDTRTDSFADLGRMYGSKPGFYLIVGPNWRGKVPSGINQVFRAKSDTAFVVPRLFQDDTDEDRKAVRAVISQIDMYPLAEYDGKMKRRDWTTLPRLASPMGESGGGETRWVFPDKFFDELPTVLRDALPMPGEEARYAEVLAVIAAAQKNDALKQAMIGAAKKADAELVGPLLQFRNFGIELPGHWSTVDNGAAFGTDYLTRTAVAKSNILVNKARETKYFYQDLDGDGQRLNGSNRYTITFAPGQQPPVDGFWSLTLYDADHFFAENSIRRYSVGTKNKDLRRSADGALTLYVQSEEPSDPVQRANWLPAPKSGDFSLYIRAYGPQAAILRGDWSPPSVVKVR